MPPGLIVGRPATPKNVVETNGGTICQTKLPNPLGIYDGNMLLRCNFTHELCPLGYIQSSPNSLVLNFTQSCPLKRGRYIYGGKAEKSKKSGGKPEKGNKFCGKPEKEVSRKPENAIF